MRVKIKGRSPIIMGASTAILISSFLSPTPANAAGTNFTAEKVMKEMDGVQRYTFVAGVVEGLAVARYMKDGKKPAAMNCIYDWFYDDKTTKDKIYAAFEKYGSYPPGSVIDVLAKQKCGE
ncbi:hypothetical protein [Nitrobacter sp.]|uniref:hypothetical protein n=1 Tax=Nitrobacter sp. TaxID=29420 RepID=UPI001D1FD952|nr:hypothetical protein [Nitrobacter sp.]MCB1392914.1 hypothetical protein [Nitrobacter sp.]